MPPEANEEDLAADGDQVIDGIPEPSLEEKVAGWADLDDEAKVQARIDAHIEEVDRARDDT